MQSGNAFYRIYLPSENKNKISKERDFTVLDDTTVLSTFSRFMDDISRKRQLKEVVESGNQNMEDVLASCHFISYFHNPVVLMAKEKDDQIPRCFKEARENPL